MQDRICPGVTFGLLKILSWTNICPCWLEVTYQPRSSVCGTRIRLGLVSNADMLLASSRRLIFGGPVIVLGLTGKSFSAVQWELIKPVRRPSISLVAETRMFLWMPIPLISGGWTSSLPRRLESIMRVVDWCESIGMVDLLSDHFDGKKYREGVDLISDDTLWYWFKCYPTISQLVNQAICISLFANCIL